MSFFSLEVTYLPVKEPNIASYISLYSLIIYRLHLCFIPIYFHITCICSPRQHRSYIQRDFSVVNKNGFKSQGPLKLKIPDRGSIALVILPKIILGRGLSFADSNEFL